MASWVGCFEIPERQHPKRWYLNPRKRRDPNLGAYRYHWSSPAQDLGFRVLVGVGAGHFQGL